jgi:hypothetical protein
MIVKIREYYHMTVAKKTNNNKAARGKNRKAGNDPAPTIADKKDTLAKQYGIRPKTKAMIDLMQDNPKLSQTEAYIQTHETTNRKTAGAAAGRILKSTGAIGYSQAALGKAKRRIIQLADSGNESIALKASQDIIDRNEGKAIQKNETTSRTVEVKLDLTGLRVGAHYINQAQVPTLTE